MWFRARALSLTAAAMLVVACGGATSTGAATGSGGAASASRGAATLTITSSDFPPGGAIPKRFTCDGEDISPALAWSGAPTSTGAFVLVVDDPDAAGFVHWIAYNLAGGASGSLPEGVKAGVEQPAQGTNDFGKAGWGGPCPPSGEHQYRFILSALAAPLSLSGNPPASQVRDALGTATVLATATLEGRYARP